MSVKELRKEVVLLIKELMEGSLEEERCNEPNTHCRGFGNQEEVCQWQ